MSGPTKAQTAGVEMVRLLVGLSPDERVEALSLISSSYCLGCGYPSPPDGQYCHCQNDE